MTTTNDRRVTSSQPLRIRAGEFNAWQDAARRINGLIETGVRGKFGAVDAIRAKNSTSLNLARGSIVGFGAIGESLPVEPTETEFYFRPAVRVRAPQVSETSVGVVVEPMAGMDDFGYVAVSGVHAVQCEVVDTDHTQWDLDPTAGDATIGEVTHVLSVEAGGRGELLWHTGFTGVVDALIMLGGLSLDYDRCDAQATVDFDGNDASVVVDNIAATRGLSPVELPTDTLTAGNPFQLAGVDDGLVGIEWSKAAGGWRIYAVQHQERLPVVEIGFNTPNFQKKTQSVWIPGSAAAGSWETWHTGDEC